MNNYATNLRALWNRYQPILAALHAKYTGIVCTLDPSRETAWALSSVSNNPYVSSAVQAASRRYERIRALIHARIDREAALIPRDPPRHVRIVALHINRCAFAPGQVHRVIRHQTEGDGNRAGYWVYPPADGQAGLVCGRSAERFLAANEVDVVVE